MRHLDLSQCGHVVVRPSPPGQASPTAFDYDGTTEALEVQTRSPCQRSSGTFVGKPDGAE